MLDAAIEVRARERKSKVLNFRVPPSVEEQLEVYVDPTTCVTSPDQAARNILLEALAEREHQRRLNTLTVDKMRRFEVFTGDAQGVLLQLPPRICRTCVTSPPYWRKVDYKHPDQLGWEKTPEQFVSRLANIFDGVKRVLRDDGTLWVVIDDTYFKKELAGVPWLLAFEMKRRGWIWRAEIVWAKPGVKPEACKDRPTRSHESVLLFTKKRTGYYFNQMLDPHTNPWAIDCIKKAQETGQTERPRSNPFSKEERRAKGTKGITRAEYGALMNPDGKNKRDVWTVTTTKFAGAHSATMPVKLAEICLLAGSSQTDVVLDPFCGTGTTGVAAVMNERKFIGIDLLPRFAQMANARMAAII